VPADDQLARVLGPNWQALRFTQLYDRAYRLRQRTLDSWRAARQMMLDGAEAAQAALRDDVPRRSQRRRPRGRGDRREARRLAVVVVGEQLLERLGLGQLPAFG
jgi:hypothetical protein